MAAISLPSDTQRHPASLLSLRHKAVVLQLAMHLVYFGRLPSDAFYEYPHNYLVKDRLVQIKWGHPLAQGTDSVLAAIDELFEAWWDSSKTASNTAHNDDAAHLAVLGNFVAYRKTACAQSVEQIRDFLASRGQLGTLSLLNQLSLGLVDIKNSQSFDSIVGAWDGSSLSFAAANVVCRIALDNQSLETALKALTSSIRACYVGQSQLDSDDGASSDLTRTLALYKHALGLDMDDQSLADMPELKPEVTRTSLHTSVHLWLNFMLLLAICGSQETRLSTFVFERALESVKNPDARSLLWLEYLRFCLAGPVTRSEPAKDKAKHAALVLGHALAETHPDVQHPFALKMIGDSSFLRLAPLRDDVWIAAFSDYCLQTFSLNMAQDLASLLCQQFSAVFPSARSVVRFLDAGALDTARGVLFHWLKHRVDNGLIWRLALAVEATSDQARSSSDPGSGSGSGSASASGSGSASWLRAQADKFLRPASTNAAQLPAAE
ncbi:hypothetical protein BC831DRAFT_439704 [Entophlyctis helioformis]|nr:hypothetical protein BC831DRAFT_439704 [Entophlyctis helioformis]